jgi:hypothetical protein
MLTEIEVLPEENIDGVLCYHFRGIVDNNKYIESRQVQREQKARKQGFVFHPSETEQQFTENLEMEKKIIAGIWRKTKFTIDFWIGKDDYIIRQSKCHIVQPDDYIAVLKFMSETLEVIKYYDFNVPISIKPPLDVEGDLLPGWSIIEQQ